MSPCGDAAVGAGTRRMEARPREGAFVRASLVGVLLLAAASWAFVFWVEDASFLALFSESNRQQALRFVSRLLGSGEAQPAFLDPESWRRAVALTHETLKMSVMAIGFAGCGMLLTVIPAARTAADGSLTLTRTRYGRVLYALIRALYVLSRTVPELIWAMLLVFIFKPGILPGALALGLHNFGILGRLCAEVLEGVDLRPARAMRSSGASNAQMLFYAVLPSVYRPFLTYLLYRWEVIVRTTIVVGFVSAGGLGREFRLAMSWFHYSDVMLLLICYALLVWTVDLISGSLRQIVK